jgi:hypothetical protein
MKNSEIDNKYDFLFEGSDLSKRMELLPNAKDRVYSSFRFSFGDLSY